MSFDANIGRTQPIIKAAANMNNDGGSGGNTGYMMRGQRKKEKEDSNSIFNSANPFDTFEMSSKLPQKDIATAMGLKPSWIENLMNKFSK